MDSNITLSITVLNYNNEKYVIDCLHSIEQQEIDSYEVFIVDDCSTDNSVEIIEEYIKNKRQFKLICKEGNTGGAISSQIGIEQSQGKYLTIVDSDDIVADGAYKQLIYRIESDGSDFAVGLPLKLNSGFSFSLMQNVNENSLFSQNRILETKEEKAELSLQGFYWNCIYKTDFIKSNEIKMPRNLLIADRIYLYKAIMRAKKISLDTMVVYYWRRKNNASALSITDAQTDFFNISDRCDSFDAQMRLALESDDGSMTKIFWENSLKRLYYPLNEILKTNIVDKKLFLRICKRYSLFLLEYGSFFQTLIYSGNISPNTKYITANLLMGNYKNIENLSKNNLASIPRKDIGDVVANTFLKQQNTFSLKDIVVEESRVYVYTQTRINNLSRNSQINIQKIILINRYYKHYKIEIDFDNVNQRFEITDIEPAVYTVLAQCEENGNPYLLTCFANKKYARRLSVSTNEKHYYSDNSSNPLFIFKKNIFTLLKHKNDFYIKINCDNDIDSIFFYNTDENRKIVLEEIYDSIFKINRDVLSAGNNILLYSKPNGIYCTVTRYQCTNNQYQIDEFSDLFIYGRIEIIKESTLKEATL